MRYLVKGLSEIHDDHIRLSVQSSNQVTNHDMKELNHLSLARSLTTETMLTVSKNVFKGNMLIYVGDYVDDPIMNETFLNYSYVNKLGLL